MKVILVLLSGLLLCSAKNSSLGKILRTEKLFDDIEILTADLLYKLDPGHCYVIITDPLYSDLLQTKLFSEIGRSTYFVIRVHFNEDLITPRTDTMVALKEANRAGCQCYLIYLANGIQMNRFLKFIDRKRTISPRVRLIILNDYRLFAPHMHYIWKRFVNVIFVRQYEQNVPANRSSNHTAFELLTVPYPLPIRSVFVTKSLDFWRNGRYRHGIKLNIDKTKDLEGQRMLVCVLKHTPGVFSMFSNENETIYSGLEVEIINGISQALNFTVEFYETDDAATEQWGMKSENGSYTGLLGEMVNGIADIALADLHYIPYHLEIMDLSIPYSTQCLTFLTPESLSDNSWQTLVLPFSSEMWAGVLFFLFCVGFVFYVFEHINIWIQKNQPAEKPSKSGNENHDNTDIVNSIKIEMAETPFASSKYIFRKRRVKKSRDIFHGFSDCILLTYSMLLVVSLPRLPQKWAVRILTGWYWIYCILIVVAYRASLTAILANPVPRVTIDTLQELGNGPIGCGVWGEQNRQFFLTTSDEVSKKVGEKIEIIGSAEEAINRVSQGKFSYYENVYFLKEMRHKHDQIESNKLKYLHIMKECAINMPISIGLEKNSPLTPSFDRLLRQIMEAGLISKWLSDSIQRFEASVEESPQEALMDLKKLYGVLFAMLIGYGIALLALIGENLYWKFVTKRNPLYDKYDAMKLYTN